MYTMEERKKSMKRNVCAMLAGFCMDMLFGDPSALPHPICWIGGLIAKTEKILRKYLPKTEKAEKCGGIFLIFVILLVSLTIPAIFLYFIGFFGILPVFLLETIICWYMLATKSLKKESMAVYKKLKQNDLKGARKAVSRIVGRDTQNLTKEGVTKAAVETVAENTTDGVVAPLFYMTMFGPLGGVFYKAVNTMDSMVGYKNEKYIYFGRYPAKLDDIINYIPARLSALFMILSAKLLGYHSKDSFKIWRRDGRNHASPNSAQTEAACAGALGIQLAGDAWYFGKKYKKPFIGDKKREIVSEDIQKANRLLYTTAMIAVFAFSVAGVLLGKKRID